LAAEMLGRPYSLHGLVVKGDERGRQIGFPTANVHFPEEKVIPANGVYVTRAIWQKEVFQSITNIGVRPTFGVQNSTKLEVHLLDFDAKLRLYGELLQVDFFEKVRDEKKFDSVDQLKTQIAADIQQARASTSLGS
jgi:riboflavin kinase/FMN adenylyltransferase